MAEKVKNETAAAKETAPKTTAAPAAKPAARKTPEHLIYAGPTIAKRGLFHWAVFRGGLPAFALEMLKEYPWAAALFVPVADTAAAKRELTDPASALAVLSARLKNELETKKEG